jgi:competence protein ComEC
MTQRIQAQIPGSSGAIAAALVTGVRGAISEEDDAALRDAGLAHALSISGLHMAMVGGGIFWLVRALLAAVPAIVLRYPIKKWAAALALAASAFYLVISGMEAAAVRAFVMPRWRRWWRWRNGISGANARHRAACLPAISSASSLPVW